MILCLKCGSINDDSVSECTDCNKSINYDYNEIFEYAQKAVYYGYVYRKRYEEDLKINTNLDWRYSLIAPSNLYDFLAIAALSGIVGNIAYDLTKYVAKKILDYLKTKTELSEQDNEVKLLIENNEELNIFIGCVINYYDGLNGLNPLVKAAIAEEEIADFASHSKVSELEEALKNGMDDKEKLHKFFLDMIRSTRENGDKIKPKLGELDKNFAELKAELKKVKKLRQKEKKKRKNKKQTPANNGS